MQALFAATLCDSCVILRFCHSVILSFCHSVILSFCHSVILSSTSELLRYCILSFSDIGNGGQARSARRRELVERPLRRENESGTLFIRTCARVRY
jgi:hypothetical protein